MRLVVLAGIVVCGLTGCALGNGSEALGEATGQAGLSQGAPSAEEPQAPAPAAEGDRTLRSKGDITPTGAGNDDRRPPPFPYQTAATARRTPAPGPSPGPPGGSGD